MRSTCRLTPVDSGADGPAAVGPSLLGRALVLMGLAGLAITQPVLDLMGRNPEFFIAGNYTSTQIVQFGAIVTVVPSLVLVVVFGLARLAHPQVGAAVHLVLLVLLGALFGNVLVRGLGLDSGWLALLGAFLGATGVLLLSLARGGRLLLQYLAVANVLFLVGFLFMSPVSALVSDDVDAGALGSVSVPVPPGPVVVIVFDELPLPTIMRSDGTVNGDRFPSFARLAAATTWFRNASSPHNRTERAVPALLTGTVLEERTMATFQELPRNLLALMGAAVRVERYEPVTDLCPRETCVAREGKPLGRALGDSLVVYGHRVLPPALRKDLAPIDDAWGDFGDEVRGVAQGPAMATSDAATIGDPLDATVDSDPLARWHGSEDTERSPSTQAARLVAQGLKIDGEPALHFVHVVLPHAPWWMTPWGTRLMRPMPAWDDVDGGDDGAWSSLIRFQRHSLQTGAADMALGQVIDHLQESGVWDDATVVVTADHGTSTIPPDVARVATDANAEEVFRVPFFLKVAGQREGEVVDDVASTVDVLPTLIDVLGIETDWEMDGHSLLDDSESTLETLVDPDVEALFEVVQRHATDFPHGWDWTALAAVGEHGALVGTSLDDLEVGAPSRLSWLPDNAGSLASLPTEHGQAPQLITGVIREPDGSEPPPLVIAANGTVAGVTGGYDRTEAGWTFSSVLGPYLVRGANQVDAYEVTEGAGGPVLHPLG